MNGLTNSGVVSLHQNGEQEAQELVTQLMLDVVGLEGGFVALQLSAPPVKQTEAHQHRHQNVVAVSVVHHAGDL